MKTEALLDYATFQLDEARTRCELWVTAGSETERLASGSLKPFLAHLSEAQNQILQGQTSIKLQVPSVAPNGRAFASSWFTKGTVERFVRFVTTPDVLERVSIVETERRQLEEAIDILSMGDQQAKQGADGEEYIDGDPAADGSKNQLLVAMDARRIMLQKEQENAFARAAAAGFDMACMADLMDFAECFGASRLREACLKFASIYKKVQTSDIHASAEKDTDLRSSKNRRDQDLHQSNMDAIPWDAASATPMSSGFRAIPDSPPNFEDRSPSTEGANSQLATPSSTRRLPRRSASPRRRSCSPMRKVQIGRSGTRKPNMVVIRNINYATTNFQGLDTANQAAEESDGSESDSVVKSEDSSEERHRRLSVQDAINLFERRQRQAQDVKVEARKETGKSVLRRWSSIGDHGTATASDAGTPGASDICTSLTPGQEPVDSGQIEPWEKKEPGSISKPREERRKSWVTTTLDLERTFQQLKLQEAALKSAKEDQKVSQGRLSHRGDRNSVSRSWSATSQQELVTLAQQSEMESRTKQTQQTSSRMREQGRFYEQYREIRDAKIRQESGLKRAEREKLKAMQEALEKKKAELVTGGGRLGEKLSSGSREHQEKLPAAKAQVLRKGTAKSQKATKPTSRTSPTLSSAQVVAVARVPRQTPAEQKTSSARKLSPSASKPSSVRGITSSPKSTGKQQATAPTQRRTVSSNHGLPDNPLTRSMPSLSELRKENTRPAAVRGAAILQQSSKIPSTRPAQAKPPGAVTRPRAASKVMPLEPNGMVASESQVPLPEERSRKSWKKPAEVEGVLAPLKEAQLEISPVVVSQVARDFLRQGRGIGPVEAPDAMEVLASATEEQVKSQEDQSLSLLQVEPVSTLEGTTEPETCGSVRDSLEMDIDENEPIPTSHHEPLRSVQAQLQSYIHESQQSRPVVPSEEAKTQQLPSPSAPVVPAALVERSLSTLSQGVARKVDAKQLTLMQQLAGDDFVDASQLSSLPEVPINNRRASLPSLGPSTSPTLVPQPRHSLSPDDGVKIERRKWGHKPALLAHQVQHQQLQNQLNIQFQQLQQQHQQQQQQQAAKEGPKGFKRLLKFGRKSRGSNAGAAEWVSASTTSEGEDTDDSGSHPQQTGSRSSFFSLSNFRSKTGDSSKSKS